MRRRVVIFGYDSIMGLNVAILEYWMDFTNVLSITPWQARPKFIEGVDSPVPLFYLINGGLQS